MNKYMILPMAFYVGYIFVLGMITFRVRKNAVKSGHLDVKHFKSYATESPEHVRIAGRHFDNQFQLPTLFFITCLTYMTLNLADSVSVLLAWLFVGLRIRHTQVHLGHNKILPRAITFFLGFLVLLVMWLQIVYQMWMGA